ncbi:hypothetical protein SAMN05444166_4175 [Singulisphaera sp. GP187]|uniref:hypothetical protein n=1 Tax=Singulisphaera sp. GP187 TaxID=1882752 RepID=UPI00092BCFDD|nr:hypothetical protein [Singulisphaera sp. GP187]SIO37222.1 hypothetical protein SAMN05444166_4175 [Singulisphaera sp. GP187]
MDERKVSSMPNRIPILAASDIAKAHGCSQVIVLAWDGKKTHVVTYGESVEDCDQAAQGGNRVKVALGWPESLCNEEPSRVKKLKDENYDLKVKIKELEGRLRNGDGVARMVNQQLSHKVKSLEALLVDRNSGHGQHIAAMTADYKPHADYQPHYEPGSGSDPGDDPDQAGY